MQQQMHRRTRISDSKFQMKHYLHLADSGLVLSDLSLRLYDSSGDGVSILGVTMEELDTSGDYVLDDIPDISNSITGLTLAFEQPSGVFHSYRFGLAESQPANIVIPIREVFADPLTDLDIVVLRDGIEFGDVSVSQLAVDGEYLIYGWDSPSTVGENWSIRWTYNGQVFSVQWIGNQVTGPTYYIHILARQSPFEYGKDPLGRVLFSCNYDCRAVYPVTNFIHEMAKLVIDSGLGVLEFNLNGTVDEDVSNLFIGPQFNIPSGDGPYTTLKQTGGFASDESHTSEYLNLGLQVIVVAQDYDLGDARAKAIHNLLNKKRSFTVSV